MTVRIPKSLEPGRADAQDAARALQRIKDYLANHPGGEDIRVTVMPNHAELTTRQAAEILNVSRPYLIGLLDAGKIPHRLVGRHRRVLFEDLMAYKRQSDAASRKAADDLTALSEELGLY